MSAHDVAKAVALLDGAGVLDRLKVEAQAEREIERAKLLEQLAESEAHDAELGKSMAGDVAMASERVSKAESELRAAKIELMNLTQMRSHIGVTSGQLRGKLRALADPEIDEAERALSGLFDRARDSFRSRETFRVDPLSGRKTAIVESNATTIADILANIRQAHQQLDALREAPRPENLAEVLAAIVEPIQADVRALVGI